MRTQKSRSKETPRVFSTPRKSWLAQLYCLVALWLGLGLKVALGDTISYSTNTTPDAYMPWTGSVDLPQFYQPFTRLETITWTASGSATVYANVRNNTSANDFLTVKGTNTITVTKPLGDLLVLLDLFPSASAGVLGNQSKSALGTATTNVSGALSPGEFSSYVGTGTVTFAASAPAGTIVVTVSHSTVLNKQLWGTAQLTLTYSFTTLGLTQQDPIPPASVSSNISFFTDMPSGRWFGSAATSTLRFDMTTPGKAFTDILAFPTGYLASFTVSTNQVDIGQFVPGQALSFGAGGVTSFTIRGIKPTGATFPIQLAFTDTNSSFTVTAIPDPPALVAWGNAYGATPANVASVSTIGAGWYHSFLRRGDGSASLWGVNNYQQTDVPFGVSDIVAMAGGQEHTVVLLGNGHVRAWGEDFYGQCDISSSLANIVSVAAGTFNSYVLTGDGYVYGWGSDDYGGVTQPLGLYNIISISSLVNHGLALRSDGAVIAWGDNSHGETNIPPGLANVVAVAAGNGDSMALQADGHVLVWGNNSFGQTNVPAGLSNVVAIAAGFYHCLALRDDGKVVAWGWDNYQQTNVPPGLSNVVAIAAGGYQSLALIGSGLAAPNVQVTNPTHPGASFSLQVGTTRGKTYYLQHRDSLGSRWWTPSRPVAGDGSVRTLADPIGTVPQRYYRVWQKP